jgi:NitT/TauT family transport system substrate-binding protein
MARTNTGAVWRTVPGGSSPVRGLWPLILAAVLALAAGACGGDDSSSQSSGNGAPADKQVTLRLGNFPNITHATAIVGVESGIFARELGDTVKLETATFNAGPSAVEALFSGALDATYIGPNPAINAYVRSKGEAVRIISGATSGGAFFVVKPEVNGADDLRGKKVASPQLGNTQDVALRAWLKSKGLRTELTGGGDVSIVPQENAQTLEAFRTGQIAGAWVPEPWATRLIQEGGGKVLVDERTLWPDGRYVTTHLIVRTAFLKDHPDVVERLLRGQVEANAFVNAQPEEAQRIVNRGIEKITGRGLPEPVIAAAWRNLEFTNDPIASSLRRSADDATAFGLLDRGGVSLDKIYDLTPLNAVLKQTGNREVALQ